MKTRSIVYLSSSILALSMLAQAPAAAEDVAEGPIIVTATRSEQPLETVGSSATVIGKDEIEALQTSSAAELLRSVPGVTVARSGGLGSTTSLFIRGAESAHTLVLIDGVRINDVATPAGTFDFANLMTSGVERIEVVRGSQSVLWGSQAMGGVINFISERPADGLRFDGSAEVGSLNTARADGRISGRSGPVGFSFGADYHGTEGISGVNRDRGGYERDGFRHKGARGRITVDLGENVDVDFRGWYASARAGYDNAFPGAGNDLADSPDFSKTTQFVLYAGLNARLLDGRFTNRFSISRSATLRDLLNPLAFPYKTFDSHGETDMIEYQGGLDLTDALHADFGASLEKSRYRSSSYFYSFDPFFGEFFSNSFGRGTARQTSVYGQIVARPVAGLVLTGGVRHDWRRSTGGYGTLNSFARSSETPRSRSAKTVFSANGSYTPDGGVTVIRASYGEGFYAPTLYELLSEYGNRGLKPETSTGWDAGIVRKLFDGQVELGLTYFRRKTSNLVTFISCAGSAAAICVNRPNGTYDNITRALSKGIEATFAFRPNETLNLRANYSHATALNLTTRKDQTRRPRDRMAAMIDWTSPWKAALGLSVTHAGKSWDVGLDTAFRRFDVRLPAYTLVDIRASYPITDSLEVYGRIENLTNRHYEAAYRYGSLPRTAYAGVRVKL